MTALAEELGVPTAVALDREIAIHSEAPGEHAVLPEKGDSLILGGDRFYFSARKVRFPHSGVSHLTAVTLAPVSELRELTNELFLRIALVSLVAILLTGAVILLATQRLVTRPLTRLMEGVRKVSMGNLDTRVTILSQDEAGMLAQAFNEMSGRLSQKSRELVRTVDELEKTRNYVKNIIDSMPSIGIDPSGNITDMNREAEKQSILPLEEARGKGIAEIFPRMQLELANIKTAVCRGRPVRDTKVPGKGEGGTRFSDITIYPLISNGVQGAVIRVDDVTDRVRLEEMMVQAEKMMSVGGLAAGMAHEINNPLAGILQNAQVIINRMTADLPANHRVCREIGTDMKTLRRYMEKRNIVPMLASMLDAGERASRIVSNMLTFSRKSELTATSCDLGTLMDQTVTLAENDYDLKKKYDFRKVALVREYDPGLPPVPCQASKIQQVLLNLLKNAAHAMILRKDVSDPPRITLRLLGEKNQVRIEVEDNGPGMEESVRKRIFEPFYTTKEVGQGTGLGLSIAYFLVTEDHGGTMTVESAPGTGSRFILTLPRPA